MEIKILCNEKGTGKTTFALKHYCPCQYYTQEIFENSNFNNDVKNIQKMSSCIIDSVDSISEPIFCDIMNKIISIHHWKKIIIIFDITKTQLIDCPNFNMIWECGLIPRNYTYENFVADKKVFYNFFHDNYPELNSSSYDDILKITDFNFKRIDRLMLLNHLHNENNEEIDPNALVKYIDEIIKFKFKDIPDADIFLKKSSIIGEKFVCDALESSDCFGYDAASSYLKQMQELHGFIRNCIDAEEQYEFISHDVYQGIFNGISIENKTNWLKILIQYYKNQYNHCSDNSSRFSILNKLKDLFILLPSFIKENKSLSFLLLYEYRKAGNTYKSLETAKEIVETMAHILDKVEYEFVQNYRIKTLIQIGEYQQALEILQYIDNLKEYSGSRMFIKYHYAFCLYQTGNIDLAYSTVEELIDYLKIISGSNRHPQELFCLTYSLMATIQNHLGLEDNGFRYFHLALNNAWNKLDNKTYYYDILKKCDMFYDYKETKQELERCLDFYVMETNWNSAGEVYTNLATEMMFQDCTDSKQIKDYFNKALICFSDHYNEKLAYTQNNMGIYYIIVENNIEKGLKLFKDSLFMGLSDFSYMSIYLNVCMCYVLLNRIDSQEFLDAKTHFNFANRKLIKRQHESLYEKIYGQLLEIIIDEHQGKEIKQSCTAILHTLNKSSFFVPLLKDIIKRNHQEDNSSYNNNSFYYSSMNRLHSFFAEFRFWE